MLILFSSQFYFIVGPSHHFDSSKISISNYRYIIHRQTPRNVCKDLRHNRLDPIAMIDYTNYSSGRTDNLSGGEQIIFTARFVSSRARLTEVVCHFSLTTVFAAYGVYTARYSGVTRSITKFAGNKNNTRH